MLENSNSDKYQEICEKLDDAFVRKLELIQEYVDLTLKMEIYQKEGYHNLAKSRYVTGSHSTSLIHVPTEESEEEFSAVVTVSQKETEKPTELAGSRNIFFEKLWEFNNADITDAANSDKKILQKFGGMPNSFIKLAQKHFKESLALSLNRLNVVSELQQIQREYLWLLDLKKTFSKDVDIANVG